MKLDKSYSGFNDNTIGLYTTNIEYWIKSLVLTLEIMQSFLSSTRKVLSVGRNLSTCLQILKPESGPLVPIFYLNYFGPKLQITHDSVSMWVPVIEGGRVEFHQPCVFHIQIKVAETLKTWRIINELQRVRHRCR